MLVGLVYPWRLKIEKLSGFARVMQLQPISVYNKKVK